RRSSTAQPPSSSWAPTTLGAPTTSRWLSRGSGDPMRDDLYVEAAAATHPGRRRINADAFLTFDAGGLFAVADGMGDRPTSSNAAQIAVESVRMRFRETWMWLPMEERSLEGARMRLAHGVALAHTRLYRPGPAQVHRIGTTFAGLVVCGPDGGVLCLAHVGDSRVLLLRRRAATLEPLTRDHTVREEGSKRRLPVPSASGVFRCDALTRAVGATRNAAPDLGTTEWAPGDIAVLCTNGVSDRVGPDELAEVLLEEPD